MMGNYKKNPKEPYQVKVPERIRKKISIYIKEEKKGGNRNGK